MKIAIAVDEKSQDTEISDRGARASHYLVFNEKEKLVETIKNPFAVGSGGAGFAVAKMLGDKGINIFIAGNIGGNMQGALEEKKIKFLTKSGDVKSALKEAISQK